MTRFTVAAIETLEKSYVYPEVAARMEGHVLGARMKITTMTYK